MPRITEIEVTNAGDGSYSFELKFDDGSTSFENADVPYEGYVRYHIAEDGSTREEVFYE